MQLLVLFYANIDVTLFLYNSILINVSVPPFLKDVVVDLWTLIHSYVLCFNMMAVFSFFFLML